MVVVFVFVVVVFMVVVVLFGFVVVVFMVVVFVFVVVVVVFIVVVFVFVVVVDVIVVALMSYLQCQIQEDPHKVASYHHCLFCRFRYLYLNIWIYPQKFSFTCCYFCRLFRSC